MPRVGVVFASTGGNKLKRSVRSFQRAEPGLTVHVVLDVMSGTWRSSDNLELLNWLGQQNNLKTHIYEDNTNHWINGTLNAAVKWIGELGYSHACLFHDDLVFSPLVENTYHVSEWFSRLETDEVLREAPGLSFSLIESFTPGPGAVEGLSGIWHRSPAEWDSMDLESKEFWEKLLPGGKTVGYFGEMTGKPVGRVQFDTWFVHYYVSPDIRPFARLGPTGQILPIDVWDSVGRFDESAGLVYDMEYPARCAVKGLPPVLVIPNTPHLHLHNQSIAYADPAVGLWGDCLQSFIKHYGADPRDFWNGLGPQYPKFPKEYVGK